MILKLISKSNAPKQEPIVKWLNFKYEVGQEVFYIKNKAVILERIYTESSIEKKKISTDYLLRQEDGSFKSVPEKEVYASKQEFIASLSQESPK